MPPPSQPAVLADLSHNALIAITGDDATTFLHAQLTNDVAAMKVGEAQWNGWCTPKGRLLTTFLLVKRPEGYLALIPAEIAPAIAKRLAMFVLRSKVKLHDASAEYDRYGIFGADAGRIVAALGGGDVVAAAIDSEHFVVLVPHGKPLEVDAPRAGPQAWDLALIRAGIPMIVAATQEAFVPQMANFELVGGVSFHKGCYPGQEIVARMQYRGGLKRRMALAHVDGPAAPEPGQSVYSAAFGEQSAGTVVNSAPAPEGGYDFLVVAQIESLRDGDLRLGSPAGTPISIRTQPPLDAPAR